MAVFQVLAADGGVTGAGFLTDEGTGFTCAHVVRRAGGSPGDRVEVVFPHLPDAPRVMADVVAEGWRAPEADDVAVLRLEAVPAGARGMAVGVSAGCRGHRVFSFGFPAQAPQGGHFGYAEAGDLLPAGNGAVHLLQLTRANDLTTGFSGAPVVDEVTGLVIGMVSSIASSDVHGKGLGIAYATPAEVLRDVRPRLAEHQVCPYLGLEPFTARHADWFHGRGAALERVLAALGENRRLLMLLGPSGAGKSSLVNAAVLPALAKGAVPGSDRWLPVYARPGRDLLTQLEDAGLPGAAADGLAAAAGARLAVEPDHDRLLLVIDQFEEILAQLAPVSDRGADGGRPRAVDQLVELADSHADVTVLLVMRNDFYAPLDALAPGLMNAAVPGLCNIPATLSRPELKEIINRPAAAVGLPLEADLADRIVNDILDTGPTARHAPVTLLPALELALRQLWVRRRREDGSLTHAAYEKIGKVTGSLTAWCNRALGQLPGDQHPTAQRILTALVRPADETNGIPATRRLVSLTRLRALAADPKLTRPAADAAFDVVLEALTRYRIVTTGTTTPPGAASGEPAAELIHDALIRDWADLRDWVAQDHQFQVWHLRAAEQQTRHARSRLPGDLLDGSLLAEGEEWAGQRPLPAEITSLLEASRQRQQADIQRQQADIRRTRRINTILAGLLALTLIATGIAFYQRQTAIGQRDRAASAQVAGTAQSVRRTDPELARRLAVASGRLAGTPESWSALLALRNQWEDDALKLPGFVATESDLDGTGQTFVGAAGTRVEFWNVKARVKTGSYTAPARVHQVDLSDDGKTATVSTDDGYTRLLDVSSARPRTTHTYPTAKESTGLWPRTTVSPLGTYLMTESIEATDTAVETTLAIWDTRTVRKIITMSSRGPVSFLADSSFSPDERVLSLPSGGQGKPFTWFDTHTKKKLPVPLPYGVKATDIQGPVVFSPDGKSVALTLKGGKINVFDRRGGGHLGTELKGAEDPDYPLYFSHDGRFLVRNAIVWDTEALRASEPVMRYATTQSECHPLTPLRFTADDSKLRCAGTDGVVRSLDVRAFTKTPESTGGYYDEGAVSLDRSTFALRTRNDIEIWSPLSRTKRSTMTSVVGSTGQLVDKMQPSRDGRLLAVVADTQIEIWDTAKKKPSLLGSLSILEKDQSGGATQPYPFAPDKAVAFSPDSKSLAVQVVKAQTNTLTFWDLTTMRRIREVHADLGYPSNGGAVFFQPDGKSVIAAPNLGRVAFPSGRVITKGAPSLEVDSTSDDGATIYTYPRKFRPYIRLWDAQTLLPEGNDLRTGAVTPPLLTPERASAASSDGRLFATVHQSGPTYQIKVWDSRTRTQLGAPLTGYIDEIVALAFAPDGSALTSMDRYGRFFTYTIAPAQLIRDLCAKSGPLTEQEWKTYIPDIPYRKTC
ncbi:nSTAND1 domain-containing NTPase [Streptomyces lunaelactis]|uniref:nSTAND1 domain-containing NTPase n=1 Tax=Streptomyces lunaelactis TaxID=1535768 RepID=UPI00131F0188|nr:trypsin-like peptidase domain-containing protein [Streptomyces lunaelactis]